MAVCANNFTFVDFGLNLLEIPKYDHGGNRGCFLETRKVIELEGSRMLVVTAISASTLEFGFVNKGSSFDVTPRFSGWFSIISFLLRGFAEVFTTAVSTPGLQFTVRRLDAV